MTEAINFEGHFDADATSVERARETPVAVERVDSTGPFLVAFEDGERVHEVTLTRDGDEWRGSCWSLDEDGDRVGRCRGWVHHDGPCAHLWAVRSEAFIGEDPAAGADEREFGRPEEKL